MKLVLKIMVAIILCTILSVIVDVIGIIWLLASGKGWIFLVMLVADLVIYIAGISRTIIVAHEKGIYLR